MLSCQQASQLVSQSLDRPLSAKERFALRLHLWICKYCRRFARQMHDLRMALKKLSAKVENDQNIHLPSAVRARIAEVIESTKN